MVTGWEEEPKPTILSAAHHSRYGTSGKEDPLLMETSYAYQQSTDCDNIIGVNL